MRQRRVLVMLVTLCAAALSGCSREVGTTPFGELHVVADTTPLLGGTVAQPIVGAPRVRVTRDGRPVAGVTVRFAVLAGGGVVQPTTVTSGADGWATAELWTAGVRAGAQRLMAFVPSGGANAAATFEVSAAPAPAVSATVEPAFVALNLGATTTLTGTLRDQYGNEVTPSGAVSYTTSAPAVVQFPFSDPRTVAAVGAGWAPVVFTADGLADTTFVAVAAPVPAPVVDSLSTGGSFSVAMGSNGRGLMGAPGSAAVRFTLTPFAVAGSVVHGASNSDIAFTPGTDTAWIADQALDRLMKVDASTNTLLATIPLPATPSRVRPAPDGSQIYVATLDGVLLRVHPTTHAITSAPVTGLANALAVSPAGDVLFIGTQGGALVRVAAATLTVAQAVQVGGTPRDIVVSADGQRVYVARTSGGLRMHRASDLAVFATEPSIVGSVGLGLGGGGSVLVVTNESADRISLVDAYTLWPRAEVTTDGPVRVASVPGATTVLVAIANGFLLRLGF